MEAGQESSFPFPLQVPSLQKAMGGVLRGFDDVRGQGRHHRQRHKSLAAGHNGGLLIE